MKTLKFLLVLVVMCVVASCEPDVEYPKASNTLRATDTIVMQDNYAKLEIYTITIDSCQYLFGRDYGTYNGGYFITHKGNCNNPIHTHPAMVDTKNHITLIPITLK